MLRVLLFLACLAVTACTALQSPLSGTEGEMSDKQLAGTVSGNGSVTVVTEVEGTVDPTEPETPAEPTPILETSESSSTKTIHCDIGDHDVAAMNCKTTYPDGTTVEGTCWDVTTMTFDTGRTLTGCRTCWSAKVGITP